MRIFLLDKFHEDSIFLSRQLTVASYLEMFFLIFASSLLRLYKVPLAVV